MLTQRQLVNTIQVQLLTTEGPLPAIDQDSNLLLPWPRDPPPGEHIVCKMAWDWQLSFPVCLVSYPRNHCQDQCQGFFPVFSSKSFTVSVCWNFSAGLCSCTKAPFSGNFPLMIFKEAGLRSGKRVCSSV
ncbi:uncharacterized protein LOC133096744 isoform X2 [Eubalaena glacialis]|uniref:uncharacterized protein LOC133096744 isoform X2 n=1 Tax=Eubalaena glacialis TaxID=27606 RepID=UPI002A59F02C|nr:uncharacterized protein LOC133096744 isoform X2 [Eubalaena glacialis]